MFWGILEDFPALNVKITFLKQKRKLNWFLILNVNSTELSQLFISFFFLHLNHKLKTSQNRLRFLPPPPRIFFSLFIQKKTLCIKRALSDSCSNLLLFFFGERWVTSYNNFNIITVHMLFFFNFTVSSSSKPFTTEVPSTVIMNSLLSFSVKWIMQIVK